MDINRNQKTQSIDSIETKRSRGRQRATRKKLTEKNLNDYNLT